MGWRLSLHGGDGAAAGLGGWRTWTPGRSLLRLLLPCQSAAVGEDELGRTQISDDDEGWFEFVERGIAIVVTPRYQLLLIRLDRGDDDHTRTFLGCYPRPAGVGCWCCCGR